jgi:hypothetical protein
MTNQTFKTNLISWQICLGLAPLPDRVLRDIESGAHVQQRRCDIERVIMSVKEVAELENLARPMLLQGDTATGIYDSLIQTGRMPKNENGNYPSYATIAKLVTDLRKEMGLYRSAIDKSKIAHEMKVQGFTYEEIAKHLHLKVGSAMTIVSKYKRHLKKKEINDSQKVAI